MVSENNVILYGFWPSPYVKRVEFALKLKGIPYEHVEEDMKNKSPTLVALNPVHKKVPVLVHNGRPICESLVILEYIDQTWPSHGHKLLPEDTYGRAEVKFWAFFLQLQVFDNMVLVLKTEGDMQRKAVSEVRENVQILVDRLDPSLTCINKANMGFLDIVFCSFFGDFTAAMSEIVGMHIVDIENNPFLSSWCKATIDLAPSRKKPAPRENLVVFLKSFRKNALKSARPQIHPRL